MTRPRVIMTTVVLLLAVLLSAGGCAARPERPQGAGEEGEERRMEETDLSLTLTYYGQSAFLIDAGIRILVDPYRPEVGYGQIDLPADLVTVSHHHFDHDYAAGGRGAELLSGLNPEGDWLQVQESRGGINIYTVDTYHDSRDGSWLGKNSIFVFEIAGLRLVHTGDLGHPLDKDQLERIGRADLLFIPVGGHYTLPREAALQVIGELQPALVIPMHYRTAYYNDQNLGTLEDFLDQAPPYPVCKKGSTITVGKPELPASPEIWTMEIKLPSF